MSKNNQKPNPQDLQNYLILAVMGADRVGILSEITQTCSQCGCNIIKSHISLLGNEFSGSFMIRGKWSSVAKMETMLPGLEQRLGLTTMVRRTQPLDLSKPSLLYNIQVYAMDRAGIMRELSDFISGQSINILQAETESFLDSRTQTPMLNLEMIIQIPAKLSIANLREQFMSYCDDRNLDAILEPLKWNL